MQRFEPFSFYEDAFKHVLTRHHPCYIILRCGKPLVAQDGLDIFHRYSLFGQQGCRQMSNGVQAKVFNICLNAQSPGEPDPVRVRLAVAVAKNIFLIPPFLALRQQQ